MEAKRPVPHTEASGTTWVCFRARCSGSTGSVCRNAPELEQILKWCTEKVSPRPSSVYGFIFVGSGGKMKGSGFSSMEAQLGLFIPMSSKWNHLGVSPPRGSFHTYFFSLSDSLTVHMRSLQLWALSRFHPALIYWAWRRVGQARCRADVKASIHVRLSSPVSDAPTDEWVMWRGSAVCWRSCHPPVSLALIRFLFPGWNDGDRKPRDSGTSYGNPADGKGEKR